LEDPPGGATLWTSIRTRLPAASASAASEHRATAEVVRQPAEHQQRRHDRNEVRDGGEREVGLGQPVGLAVDPRRGETG
jgi:hypothetical protein